MSSAEVEGRGYFAEIWRLRYFWSSLVANDLRNRYRRSFLGIGWSLVRPLLLMALYCLVFGELFRQPAAEYAPFLMIGLTLWQFLQEAVLAGCESFRKAGPYIRQERVPLAIFPLRTVLNAGFHAAVALTVGVAMAAVLRGPPSLRALLAVLPGLVLLFLLGWALAILSGALRCRFPDVPHLLELGMQALMYLTPIIYPPSFLSGRGWLSTLAGANPLGALVSMIREPLLGGELPAAPTVLNAVLCVGAACLLAAVCLRWLERTLVFWV